MCTENLKDIFKKNQYIYIYILNEHSKDYIFLFLFYISVVSQQVRFSGHILVCIRIYIFILLLLLRWCERFVYYLITFSWSQMLYNNNIILLFSQQIVQIAGIN